MTIRLNNIPWNIQVTSQLKLSPSLKKAITKAAKDTLLALPKTSLKKLLPPAKSLSLDISVVGIKKMQKVNLTYRKKNKPTDVLSFSRLETKLPALPHLSVGDVVLCLPVAKTQAKSEGVSIKFELRKLTIHGVLHVFGYDHERSPHEERKMFRLQNRILKDE